MPLTGLDGRHAPAVGCRCRAFVDAELRRQGRTVHVRVEDAHASPAAGQSSRQLERDRRLAHAALFPEQVDSAGGRGEVYLFLKKGDVFSDDQIDAYMDLKWEEIFNFEHPPHPLEFQM